MDKVEHIIVMYVKGTKYKIRVNHSDLHCMHVARCHANDVWPEGSPQRYKNNVEYLEHLIGAWAVDEPVIDENKVQHHADELIKRFKDSNKVFTHAHLIAEAHKKYNYKVDPRILSMFALITTGCARDKFYLFGQELSADAALATAVKHFELVEVGQQKLHETIKGIEAGKITTFEEI